MSVVAPRMERQILRSTGPAALGLVFVVLLIPVALTSMRAAVACIALLALTTLVLILGASRTANALLVVAFATVNFTNVYVTGSLRIADPFFAIGVLLLLPRFLSSPVRMPTAFTIGALGLSVVGIVSAVASGQASANLSYFLGVVKGVIVLPVLLVWWRPERRTVVTAASAYVLGNCINLVAALINGPSNADRYGGLSTHPNLMGYGQVLSLAFIPFLAATLPRGWRWLLAVAAPACAYGIFLSGSRGALLGAVGVGLLYPLLMRSIKVAMGVGALFVPALVIVSNAWHDPSSSTAIGRLLGASSGQVSDNARTQGAQYGVDQFLHHPLLGGGWPTIWGVHTGYLQVAAAIGVFGVAFYLLLLTSVLKPLATVASPYNLLAVPALAAVMLDLVLPVIGAMFEWSAVGLALCAAPLAARERARLASTTAVEGNRADVVAR